MKEWCQIEEFRKLLPTILEGEDEEFSRHINAIAQAEAQNAILAQS